MDRLKELLRPYYLRWLYFRLFPGRHPKHFKDAWRYPSHTLDQDILPLLPPGENQPDILFLPMTDWHTRIQRSQQLAMAMAELGHRCLYLNPHLGREYPKPYLWSKAALLSSLGERIGELHVHLPREPVFHARTLTDDEVGRILDALKIVIRNLQVRSLLQVVSFPLWLPVARELKSEFGFPIVYDCHDLLTGFSNISPAIVETEAELLRRCDLAVFSSQRLLQQMGHLNTQSMVLRNAVNPRHFAPGARTAAGVPVIGYMGALDRWFDVEAVAQAAEQHPGWRFVLIGRVEDPRVLSLSRFLNVEFRGEVAYADLPEHAGTFTVGIIPFLRNDLTLATNPIKLYEYFSLGIPVVSTDLPEVARFADLVYLAETRDFTARLEQAIAEEDEALQRARIAIAEKESWSRRAKTLLGSLTELS